MTRFEDGDDIQLCSVRPTWRSYQWSGTCSCRGPEQQQQQPIFQGSQSPQLQWQWQWTHLDLSTRLSCQDSSSLSCPALPDRLLDRQQTASTPTPITAAATTRTPSTTARATATTASLVSLAAAAAAATRTTQPTTTTTTSPLRPPSQPIVSLSLSLSHCLDLVLALALRLRLLLLFVAFRCQPTFAAADQVSCTADDDQCSSTGESILAGVSLDDLRAALGRRPRHWSLQPIATILASIGEGDYGQVARLNLEFDDEPTRSSLIVKHVVPKAVEQVGSDEKDLTEHWRFLQGFAVEARAYQSLYEPLQNHSAPTPKLFLATPSWPLGREFAMFMEDMSATYPRGSNGQARRLGLPERRGSLRWLARFHAAFWEDSQVEERGLWHRGSYWIYDDLARLEMARVPQDYQNRYLDRDDVQRLRRAGPAIDARLAGGRSVTGETRSDSHRAHRTLIHGDAKPENILCSGLSLTEGWQCAGIDFSWVGEGYAMYDVVYLFWDILGTNEVWDLLQEYRKMLLEELPLEKGERYSNAIMRQHFVLCVVDFMRWQLSFRRGGEEYFWAMPWAIQILRDVLDQLDGGTVLPTEDDYAVAVAREFPY